MNTQSMTIKLISWVAVICFFVIACPVNLFALAPQSFFNDTINLIELTFKQMEVLKPMKPNRDYTSGISGSQVTGKKETFLRKRTSKEILESGFASGCGDYGVVFYDLMKARGSQNRI